MTVLLFFPFHNVDNLSRVVINCIPSLVLRMNSNINTDNDDTSILTAFVDQALHDVFTLAHATLLLTSLLELISWRTTRAVWNQSPSLYLQALLYNGILHYLLGIPVYTLAAALFCRPNQPLVFENTVVFAGRVVGILVIHAILYYSLHRTFHSHAWLYRHVHQFHHRFKQYTTPPMAANAVTVAEYALAYVLPFVVAGGLVRPTLHELKLAVGFISVCNLLVHTPCLQGVPGPPWWVMPHDHLEHHRKVTAHYASPTVNIDWFVEQGQQYYESHGSLSGRKSNSSNKPTKVA